MIFEALPWVVAASNSPVSNSKFAILLISPLNSIIFEQLSRYGDSAIEVNDELNRQLKIHHSICLSSNMGCSCTENVKKLVAGNSCIALATKRKFWTRIFFKELHNMSHISHIVIDEAHCVDKWGGEFRKDFARLKD